MKPKTYVWLNPDMKKYLKMTAIEKNKKMIDLKPCDFENEYIDNREKRVGFKFRI
jgi:hypothetical protein